MIGYVCTDKNVKIFDSYLVSKKDFTAVLEYIKVANPDNKVLNNRKWWHMRFEWAVHNFLHDLNVNPERTKDVDLNYQQSIFEKLIYLIAGPISLIFIK